MILISNIKKYFCKHQHTRTAIMVALQKASLAEVLIPYRNLLGECKCGKLLLGIKYRVVDKCECCNSNLETIDILVVNDPIEAEDKMEIFKTRYINNRHPFEE